MIKIKARRSFCGKVSMHIGEERECEKTKEVMGLVDCGYVELLEDEEVDVNQMKKEELLRYAKAHGIEVDEKAKKEVIIEQITSCERDDTGGEQDDKKTIDTVGADSEKKEGDGDQDDKKTIDTICVGGDGDEGQ